MGGVETQCQPGIPTETPEATCNDGVDNDCDGTTDLGDQDCACVPTGTPETVCNGIDDDCDGTADEDFVTTPTNCGTGECSSSGQTTCVDGVPGDTCTPGTPAADDATCNGIDDDCDGSIDEDFVTASTTCGTGECASTGVTTCIGGVPGDTCTPGTPSAEVCDGLDNDCDGSSDEAFPGLGTSCTVGTGACEATGSYICTADGLGTECSATPGTPGTEGPGIDNDCDGLTDFADGSCQVICTDNDNDGYYAEGGDCGPVDCNDSNPIMNPGMPKKILRGVQTVRMRIMTVIPTARVTVTIMTRTSIPEKQKPVTV
jgi:hypothetical protein